MSNELVLAMITASNALVSLSMLIVIATIIRRPR